MGSAARAAGGAGSSMKRNQTLNCTGDHSSSRRAWRAVRSVFICVHVSLCFFVPLVSFMVQSAIRVHPWLLLLICGICVLFLH